MDRRFEHNGTTFLWDDLKALDNRRKHGVAFEEAVTVFDDPLIVLRDASRNEASGRRHRFQLDRPTAYRGARRT